MTTKSKTRKKAVPDTVTIGAPALIIEDGAVRLPDTGGEGEGAAEETLTITEPVPLPEGFGETVTAQTDGAPAEAEPPSAEQAGEAAPVAQDETPPEWIDIDLIDYSPRNYRKYYNPAALELFAKGLKEQGIISPVTVRVVIPGRYELVVGERRIRGGRIEGLKRVPAMIKEMTDQQVDDAQLAENVGREDSHPVHDAEAIDRMYKRNLTTQQIADRLGKLPSFVYQRRRLCSLSPEWQEAFLGEVITHAEALDIATLTPENQKAMFDNWCADWKTVDRSKQNFKHIADNFRCDLRKAVFDIKDETLDPAAGPCSLCPHNSAYSGLLFADEKGEARCGKKACFDNKVSLFMIRVVTAGMAEHQPTAVIVGHRVPEIVKNAIAAVPDAAALPTHMEDNITLWEEPEAPSKKDYEISDYGFDEYDEDEGGCDEDDCDEDDEDCEDEREVKRPAASKVEGETEYDEEGYKTDYASYEEDLAVYHAAIEDKKALKALHLSEGAIKIIYFMPVPPQPKRSKDGEGKKPKIADLMKAGTATIADYEEAIKNAKDREVRFTELDRDKVQKEVHGRLAKMNAGDVAALTLTDEDRIAMRWIAYQSIGWNGSSAVEKVLGLKVDSSKPNREGIYERLRNMTPAEETYLFRAALLNRTDSLYPNTVTGHILYKTAGGAGVDVAYVEKHQAQKAENRRDNSEIKVSLYKKHIKRLRRKSVA